MRDWRDVVIFLIGVIVRADIKAMNQQINLAVVRLFFPNISKNHENRRSNLDKLCAVPALNWQRQVLRHGEGWILQFFLY